MDLATLDHTGALVLVGVFVAIAVVELLRPAREPAPAIGRRWIGNLSLYLVSGALFLLPTLASLAAAISAQASLSGVLNWLTAPPIVQFMLGILGLDALSYTLHRLSHAVGVLWRLHAVHHSDPDVDVTTTLRHHPAEALFGAAATGAWVFVLGISPGAVAAYTMLEWSVQLIGHANLALPPGVEAFVRRLFVTPGFHQLHHSRNIAETNSNYGQVFTFWDALFRSASRRQPGSATQIEFGLDDFRDAKFQWLHWLLAQPVLPRGRAAAPARAQQSGTTRNKSVSPVS